MLVVVPRNRHVLEVLGTPLLDERKLADGLGVGEAKADALARALAAGLLARLTAAKDVHAIAERAMEAAHQRLVEAVAVGEQHHDGDDAPRDAEHRQARAHTIAKQAGHRFARDLPQHAHPHDSNRSASTGGNCAARRAG